MEFEFLLPKVLIFKVIICQELNILSRFILGKQYASHNRVFNAIYIGIYTILLIAGAY
jgi:hypothetical protein